MTKQRGQPFPDGYEFDVGDYACTFTRDMSTGTWAVQVRNRTVALVHETGPLMCRLDAYRSAREWCRAQARNLDGRSTQGM